MSFHSYGFFIEKMCLKDYDLEVNPCAITIGRRINKKKTDKINLIVNVLIILPIYLSVLLKAAVNLSEKIPIRINVAGIVNQMYNSKNSIPTASKRDTPRRKSKFLRGSIVLRISEC